ncbi:dCTP deaminase domain-containing protein [Arenimonas daejeonensis]|uniref:dCTP deaminase domain-containing protein n=1 Tax=Arenimonas daejeonensis TaxID=370777 RepID=UPI003CCE1454
MGDVLTIGKIVTHKGTEVDSLVLEPQGIAHLVSKEIVELPDDTCAFAHVLTRLCNQGLLTLNIGVVDPGWRNHVSTAILNFSSERRLLEKGQKFIRLSYHRLDSVDVHAPGESNNYPTSKYCQDVRARAVNEFGKHFLGIKQLVGKASEKETTRLRDALLKYIPIAAFSLAFFAMMVTVGVTFAAKFVNWSPTVSSVGSEPTQASLDSMAAEIESLRSEIRAREAATSHEMRQPPASITEQERADAPDASQ